MNTNNDLKSIWQQQQAPQIPDVNEIIDKAIKLKNKTRNKLLLGNILLALTVAFIIYIVLYFHPRFSTTKLGVVLIILSIVTYLVPANKMLSVLFRTRIAKSSKEYLDEMIRFKHKQEFMQKTILTIYFITLTAGIVLYMIEYTMRMSFMGAAISYGITGAWIAFNWFFIRKKTIRKQQMEINAVIEMLEKIGTQISE